MNRPVRTRTQGGVGAGGGKPPATRFNQYCYVLSLFSLLLNTTTGSFLYPTFW